MNRKAVEMWLPIGVVALPLLTALVHSWLLGGILAEMAIVAASYGRCRRFLFALTMAALVTAAVTAAAIRMRLRNPL